MRLPIPSSVRHGSVVRVVVRVVVVVVVVVVTPLTSPAAHPSVNALGVVPRSEVVLPDVVVVETVETAGNLFAGVWGVVESYSRRVVYGGHTRYGYTYI